MSLYKLQDEAIKSMSVLNYKMPPELCEDWNKVYGANVVLFKNWSDLQDIIQVNNNYLQRLKLINSRIPEFLDLLEDNIDCNETKEVLFNKFEELFLTPSEVENG